MREFNYGHEWNGWHRGPMIFIGFIGKLIGMVIMAFLFGYFVMLLWNWLMPVIFHLGTIGYWQGFGMVLLAKLLFSPFRISGPRPWRSKGKAFPEEMDWGSKDDWELKGGWHQWRHYKEYWRTEGKEAFEKYLNKMEKSKEKKK